MFRVEFFVFLFLFNSKHFWVHISSDLINGIDVKKENKKIALFCPFVLFARPLLLPHPKTGVEEIKKK